MRLDSYLAEMGYAKSRESAKNNIKNGLVSLDGKIINKPSFDVVGEPEISYPKEIFVSRGGFKLEKAIHEFELNLDGKICVDIGASTGGFTDCMLQNGAAKVYALDVGHGQLDASLVENPAVVNLENINIKELDATIFSEKIDFVTVDVSFISLEKILWKITEFEISDNFGLFVLIKPQFEVGRKFIGKNGIVSDKKAHEKAVFDVITYCENEVFLHLENLSFSPICGGDGNVEYIAYFRKDGIKTDENKILQLTKNVVLDAFSTLK